MYNHILLPTDGSAGMTRVIRHAGELAAAHDATIHALYVVDASSYSNLPMETSWDGITELLHEEGREALEAVDALVADDVPVVHETTEGSPSRCIVETAVDEACDVVVMGTHGRGGLDRILLGSVAERVVRTSEVPVLTVRVQSSVDRSSATDEGAADDERPAGEHEPTPEPGVW